MQSLKKQQYVIRRLVSHLGGHLDEAGGGTIAQLYGGDIFVGAADAPVVPEQLKGTEQEALLRGDLPLGQLCGSLDDKDESGDRRTGKDGQQTCHALRMAEFLGVEKRPELLSLLAAINRVDNEHTASPSDLSALMKGMNGCSPVSEHANIFNKIQEGVRAIIEYAKVPRAAEPKSSVDLMTLFEEFLKSHEVAGKAVPSESVRYIKGFITKSVMASRMNCIELAHVGIAMTATGKTAAEIASWYTFILEKWILQQEQFHAARQEVAANALYCAIPDKKDATILLVHSDNPQAGNASRACAHPPAVIVVRKSTGNVAILPNHNHPSGVRMEGVWAHIRLAETPLAKRKGVTYTQYTRPGNHANAPHWHIMRSGAVLNGSHFQVTTPSTLTDDQLVELILDGVSISAETKFQEIVRKSSSTDWRVGRTLKANWGSPEVTPPAETTMTSAPKVQMSKWTRHDAPPKVIKRQEPVQTEQLAQDVPPTSEAPVVSQAKRPAGPVNGFDDIDPEISEIKEEDLLPLAEALDNVRR